MGERGWHLLRLPEAKTAGGVDEDVLLAALRPFGLPSSRDGERAVWPISPRGSPTDTFSVRSGRADLHTDSQYRADPERWVSFYCVRPAPDGGASLVLSAADALAALRRHPEGQRAEALLREPAFHWRVPAIFHAGEPHGGRPVIDEALIRWRWDNLVDLGPSHAWAAALFHETLLGCDAVVEIGLAPGDLLIVDNQRALHGRTHFESADRLLMRVRLW
ncbi:MAG: TauD/TfdA family dioxygenase [bacterium]|nr:TauD/TfdA family dioxygenase [Myxococcales bacterium]